MAEENWPDPLPSGWILKNKVQKYCTNPKTGQTFYTKGDLLRYVAYVKSANLSNGSPAPTAAKQKKQASSATKNLLLTGQSSQPVKHSPGQEALLKEQPLEIGLEKWGNRKTQLTSRKSKDKRELILAHRPSKRLSGLQPELSQLEAVPVAESAQEVTVDEELPDKVKTTIFLKGTAQTTHKGGAVLVAVLFDEGMPFFERHSNVTTILVLIKI